MFGAKYGAETNLDTHNTEISVSERKDVSGPVELLGTNI